LPGEKIPSVERSTVKSVPALVHGLRRGRRVLLVGGSEFRQSLRARILRAHGLRVEVARELVEGCSLWQPNTYDWVLLDVHSQLPGEVIDFCEQLRRTAPGQRIAFFVGPPTYVSLRWPDEGMVQEKREEEERAGTLKAAA